MQSIYDERFVIKLMLSALLLFSCLGLGAAEKAHAETAKLARVNQAEIVLREELSKAASISNVKLSPLGKDILYIERKDKFDVLWVQNTLNNKRQKVFTGSALVQAEWSADSQSIVVIFNNSAAIVKAGADQLPMTIIQFSPEKEEAFFGVSPAVDAGIIVHKRDFKTNQFQLFQVEANANAKLLFTSPFPILDYLFSKNKPAGSEQSNIAEQLANFRLSAVKVFRNEQIEIHSLPSANNTDYPYSIGDNTKALVSCDVSDPCQIVGLNVQAEKLYTIARFEEDKAGVYEVSIEPSTNGAHKQMLHKDPENRFDAHTVYTKPNGLPWLVSYETDYKRYYAINGFHKSQPFIVEETERKLSVVHGYLNTNTNYDPQKRFIEIQTSDDMRQWLVFDKSIGAKDKAVYFVNHAAEQNPSLIKPILSDLFDTRSAQSSQFDKFVVNYKVSDGMSQFGYITAPQNVVLGSLPLVVMPHGGPWSRVNGSKNKLAEFIASRGYIVFEPNFRSSTGMGRLFTESANKDFGDGVVQQDIIDGMHYVLSQGIGNANKLGIVGHSFGGFSVLAGLSFSSDLFEFGFAGAPPSDLAQSIQFMARHDFRKRAKRRQLLFAKLAADTDAPATLNELSQKSPHSHWQNISKPLYIWAGKFDDRVDIRYVNEYSSLLWTAEQSITLFVDPKAGHSPRAPIQLEAYLYLLEFSLAKHLGGKWQQDVSPKLSTYLKRNLKIDENNMAY